MIDVEADVFDYVCPFISSLVPVGCFSSMYVPEPPKLPFATLIEIGNATDTNRRSTASSEEFALLSYEANVYAESKPVCRSIMDAIDGALIQLGFTRVSMQFIPNLADSTIFRYTARYRAEAGANKTIYRHA